jgi:hypothetical protein
MLSKKYAGALQKAVLKEDQEKQRQLYVESLQETVTAGRDLVEDVKVLFPLVGTGMAMEIKKNNDSLALMKDAYVPFKMLENGRRPSDEEAERIVRHQMDMSFCFVVSRLLQGAFPDDDKVAKDMEKRQIFRGDVDWIGCMTTAGDWILHYAPICRMGWIDRRTARTVRNTAEALAGFRTARECFQKVLDLTKDKPYDKAKVYAEDRIKEIDEMVGRLEAVR